MMRQIADITEKEFPYDVWRERRHPDEANSMTTTEAISSATCDIAEQTNARVIVSTTMSGMTAQQIARYRPSTPIMAVSPLRRTRRRLALVWGVDSLQVSDFGTTDEMLDHTVAAMQRPYDLQSGDKLVITAGIPFGQSGQTNLIQVHEIA